MSVLKLSSSSEMYSQREPKAQKTIVINVFLITILMLSALDLLVATIGGDSLSGYTKFVLSDLILTLLGLFFCSDLLIQKGRMLLSYFLSYMLFLWSCLTIIKLVCLG